MKKIFSSVVGFLGPGPEKFLGMEVIRKPVADLVPLVRHANGTEIYPRGTNLIIVKPLPPPSENGEQSH